MAAWTPNQVLRDCGACLSLLQRGSIARYIYPILTSPSRLVRAQLC